jgi:hypothetical protein
MGAGGACGVATAAGVRRIGAARDEQRAGRPMGARARARQRRRRRRAPARPAPSRARRCPAGAAPWAPGPRRAAAAARGAAAAAGTRRGGVGRAGHPAEGAAGGALGSATEDAGGARGGRAREVAGRGTTAAAPPARMPSRATLGWAGSLRRARPEGAAAPPARRAKLPGRRARSRRAPRAARRRDGLAAGSVCSLDCFQRFAPITRLHAWLDCTRGCLEASASSPDTRAPPSRPQRTPEA